MRRYWSCEGCGQTFWQDATEMSNTNHSCPANPGVVTICPPPWSRERGSMKQTQLPIVKKRGAFKTMETLDFPMTSKIAGISRHQKLLENVMYNTFFILDREPDNPHDANAIAVKAWGKHMLGYIPRYLAQSLAPLLDAGKVSRKATFVRRNRSEKKPDMPVGLTIKIYAKS